MATTTTEQTVTITLTPEQACTVHAALIAAATKARNQQLHFLGLHESAKVGPETKALAWQTYRTWARHEDTCAQACDLLQLAGLPLSFSAFNRFG
jgi:hypothetical protein